MMFCFVKVLGHQKNLENLRRDIMKHIQVTLTPPESKKIIALGVKTLPVVQQALKKGIILIALGTTNAYILEELVGRTVDRWRYAAGYIDGTTTIVPDSERLAPVALKNGKELNWDDIINEITAKDVVIKGANALDPQGVAGVMLAGQTGGTIGSILGAIISRGVNLIIPVGLEKSIPYSVIDISKKIGIQRCSKATGLAVGMMPLPGKVITEVEAFKLLGADEVFPIGSGGTNGGEGSITLCIIGDKADEIFELVCRIKERKKSFI